jgi:hypothetical protein
VRRRLSICFAKSAINFIEPTPVEKPINYIYCIIVLLNILAFSQKELICISLGKFVSV